MAHEIDVAQLSILRKHAGSAQLVDVRSADEFATGHVPGAANIPFEQIEQRLSDLNREQTLVLICKGGTRATMAAERLQGQRGNLMVLAGGTDAWARAGMPLVAKATPWIG